MTFRKEMQYKRPSKMIIYTLNLPWMLKEPTAYGGFMVLVCLIKLETFLFLTLQICIKTIQNDSNPSQI